MTDPYKQIPNTWQTSCGHIGGPVFEERRPRARDLERWLAADSSDPDGLQQALRLAVRDQDAWQIQEADVREAVQRASKSAAGPDGIPYAAWQELGELGVSCLWDAARTLEGEGGQAMLEAACPLDQNGQSSFNSATMVFIPKKEPEVSQEGVEFSRAEDARPLSIATLAIG